MGDLAFFLSGKYRRLIIRNLSLVFGDTMTTDRKYNIAHEVFRNLGRCTMETLKLPTLSPDTVRELVDMKDVESIFASCLDRKRSMLILTGHFSNWELFAARVAQVMPLTVLGRSNSNPHIQDMILKTRKTLNMDVLDRDDPAAARSLAEIGRRGGEAVGLLMDVDTRVKSIFSPFLGIPASTPSGPATLALRGWFDMFIGYIIRQEDGRYKMVINPVDDVERTGNRQADIQAITDRFNACLSDMIEKDLTQWTWLHKRWRTQLKPCLDKPA